MSYSETDEKLIGHWLVTQYLRFWNLFRLGNEKYSDLKCSANRLYFFNFWYFFITFEVYVCVCVIKSMKSLVKMSILYYFCFNCR